MSSSSSVWPEEVDTLARIFGDALQTNCVQPDVGYQCDAIGWIVDRLGVDRESLVWSEGPGYAAHEWDGTRDPLVAICAALEASEDVGVESGTGTGKSFLAACLILWFLACWRGARVFTFAPKEDQLRLFIWMELSKLWPRFRLLFPTAELTDLRIRMDGTDEWGAWGYAVGVRAGEDVATRAAGMHAEHMLIVTEETPGIHPSVMAAHENTCTAAHNIRLALGNPDNQQDTLHQFCASTGVTAVRISALDHPNVVTGRETIPGAVGARSIERRRLKYKDDNRLFLSRVRGISPSESASALIRWEWCVAAAARYNDERYRQGLLALGVDVANSEHGDKAAIARWQGACLTEVESKACPDASILGVQVHTEAVESGVLPIHIGVDAVGVGASTINKLKEWLPFRRVRALYGGANRSPMSEVDTDVRWRTHPDEDDEQGPTVLEAERYNNLRSQMWWQMREDLRLNRVALPDDDELFRDLTTPTYKTQGGAIVVEQKEEIIKRLGHSPDKGDAAVYGNWVRRRQPLPKDVPKPLPATVYDHEGDEVLKKMALAQVRVRPRTHKEKRRVF